MGVHYVMHGELLAVVVVGHWERHWSHGDHHWNHRISFLYVSSWVCLLCRVTREMKVNGRRNRRRPGSVDSRRVRMGNCIIAPRSAQPLAHEHAPAPNTGNAHGGTRAEHPEGRESKARAAGREQSTPWPPGLQATTHIEQLNTQGIVVCKPIDSCEAA